MTIADQDRRLAAVSCDLNAPLRLATPVALEREPGVGRLNQGTDGPDSGVPARPPQERTIVASILVALARRGMGTMVALCDLVVPVAAIVAFPTIRVGLIIFTILLLLTYRSGGFYQTRVTSSVLEDMPALLARMLAAAAIVGALGTIITRDGDTKNFMVIAILVGLGTLGGRGLAYSVVRFARGRRYIAHPALVIGCGQVGKKMADLLQENPNYGLVPAGYIDDRPLLSHEQRGYPLLGTVDDLPHVVREHGIHSVIIAFSDRPESGMVDLIRICDRLECEIFVIPRLFEVYSAHYAGESVQGMPLIRLRRPAYRAWTWGLKRLVDIVFSLSALGVASPVIAACALGVRLEGGPGILFRQERVGVDGKRFELLKFRTLKPKTDAEAATRWNIADDQRVGGFGRLLRRCSLDELPQLWNVLRGDMTLVGPRPERPYFVEQFVTEFPGYRHRHRVPSGLTGLAQVNGYRGDTSIGDRARFDNYYIENWSMWLDVKIILRTAAQVIRGAGA
ncbi:MAG: sugar transferase [Acidimicrobiales bacterium]